jgi:hypothetical protein
VTHPHKVAAFTRGYVQRLLIWDSSSDNWLPKVGRSSNVLEYIPVWAYIANALAVEYLAKQTFLSTGLSTIYSSDYFFAYWNVLITALLQVVNYPMNCPGSSILCFHPMCIIDNCLTKLDLVDGP